MTDSEEPVMIGYQRPRRPISPVFEIPPKRIWLVSFTDFMSLMVAFFLMMYAMGDTQLSKFKEVSQSIGKNLSAVKQIEPKSFSGAAGHMGESDVISLGRRSYKTGKDIKYLYDVLEQKQKGVPALAHLKTTLDGNVLNVSIPLSDLLDPASDQPAPAADAVAREMAALIAGTNNRLELIVEWRGSFDSEMTRALARGGKIRQILEDHGLPFSFPILLNQKPAQTDALAVTIRVTRFR